MPCFDEPALKAKFTLKIKLPQATAVASHVLSNTPLLYKQSIEEGRMVAFGFHETPIMSVHQLSVVISPNLQGTSTMIGNLNLTVWASNHHHEAKFAASVASKAVRSLFDTRFLPC